VRHVSYLLGLIIDDLADLMLADIGLDGLDQRVGVNRRALQYSRFRRLANQRRGAAHIFGLIIGIGLMTLLVSAGVGERLEGRAV
jgi:hypothetical protein